MAFPDFFLSGSTPIYLLLNGGPSKLVAGESSKVLREFFKHCLIAFLAAIWIRGFTPFIVAAKLHHKSRIHDLS